jgi:hypothetical protein
MDNSEGRIEDEVKALQKSHERFKSSLEQNKRERLRKCREAGILDHWRRQQKQKHSHRHHTKAMPTRDMLMHTPINLYNNTIGQLPRREPSTGKPVETKYDEIVRNASSSSTQAGIPTECSWPQNTDRHSVGKNSRQEFHNDYSQHFVDSIERPQNFIRSTSLVDRFNE